MHGMEISSVLTLGYFPVVAAMTLFQKISLLILWSSGDPYGTLFSTLQAVEHAWQPTHLSRSITIPHLGIIHLEIPSKQSIPLSRERERAGVRVGHLGFPLTFLLSPCRGRGGFYFPRNPSSHYEIENCNLFGIWNLSFF
jgi:hypothetical protein